jgi:isocitrate/isopropylmalate dehydrogenase
MMLEHLGHEAEARLVDQAVLAAVQANCTTRDLGGERSTRQVADFVLDQLEKGAR